MKFDESKLKRLMATLLKLDPTEIGTESSMDNIPSWDSLRHMNLIVAIEEEFQVVFPEVEIQNLTSYALIKTALEEQLRGT